MSRRRRALAFGSAAAVCAALAASAAGGDRSAIPVELGELRPVLVTTRALPPHRRLSDRILAGSVEVRRVPERFLPPGALSSPAELLGRSPATTIPAGSYVVASQFAHPSARARSRRPSVEPGRHAIEITVASAGSLLSGRSGRRVDVIVTTEPGPGGRGRTHVAARDVELLDLRPAGEAVAGDVLATPGSEAAIATLALTRAEALRLIQAESFARSVRLIGG